MKKRKNFSVSTLTGWVSLVLQCVLAKVSVHPGQINRQVTFLQNLAGYDKIASWVSSYLGRCKSLSSLRHWNNIQALACFGRNFCLPQKCYQMAQCDASVITVVAAHTWKKEKLGHTRNIILRERTAGGVTAPPLLEQHELIKMGHTTPSGGTCEE